MWYLPILGITDKGYISNSVGLKTVKGLDDHQGLVKAPAGQVWSLQGSELHCWGPISAVISSYSRPPDGSTSQSRHWSALGYT